MIQRDSPNVRLHVARIRWRRKFVADFDNSFQNLFFYGDTGVGKTFLSHCIAHDLLDSAHCVLYFSSFELFDFLAGSAFSRGNDAPDDEPILTVTCWSLMTWVQSLPIALYLHSFSCASMSGSCARNLRLFPQTWSWKISQQLILREPFPHRQQLSDD